MSITIITPPKTAGIVVKPESRMDVSCIDPQMTLMAGTYCSDTEDWYEEPLERGVRLILVQSGRLRCRVPGQPEHLIEGPMLCTIANAGDFTSAQVYDTARPLRYTMLQLFDDDLEGRLGWLPDSLRPRRGEDPLMISCPATKAIQALASQIATCQMDGPIRDFYLGGKALELAALSVQTLSGAPATGSDESITSAEVERIHAARAILVEALREPPTLDQLALRVGMNRRKLTLGFRKVFGTSVFCYLQEYRLREAHRMLCDEEANVSTVAHLVGYSPAHFATAFRKRYGLSPRDIR
ncbi:helix-turn-helix transcriptional regulator [Rhodospirillum rubrum]|uniref:Transcriptional regulator, AraC family n=2 Tax=Rhodospirillum rubrum TaxID=1085 RepID=Q2RW53_RHORT|nr:AraC family transcriptional regulator [Rhodospirillum rubrum]ABC21642.1 transcriptional regulator, AraC family [Rhodospirillum rubrum ATCC 11170]AEO47336.1 AraC family transcriptional regulator [Rhodospirillum rubrum F11]QXG81308.1 AraC family transcriptional regulator [Rhodospirillum rubrum]HAQ00009.1 AraC family transcriptional regulator [Rhodospirillum rubrum]